MSRAKSPEPAPLPEALRQRELEIAREIARAFLKATRPLEVYRLALARVTPLVEASFSSVFLRESDDPLLLKLVCAQNWPQASARFLGQMRIRVGRGPTGRAVAEATAFEVEDIFAEPGLREWWDPARELGFTSLISLPLQHEGEVTGALTFYFAAAHTFQAHERALLTMVTDQLAATAERAHLIQRLQLANERLERENAQFAARTREAELARRRKTEFLLNVSHELRTPLTSILGDAERLAEDPAGRLSGQQRAGVQKIERATSMMLGLVGDLLDLSQVTLGRTTLQSAQQDAEALARTALEVAGKPAEGVDFRIETPDGPVAFTADGERIVKILENLLSNAFKYTSHGEVVLTVRRTPMIAPAEGRYAVIEWEVRDTGIGIRTEDQPWIFDELVQVDGTSTRLYGGTGLGLALARALARLLGGEITMDSELGKGSTFALRLPTRVA